MPQSFNQISINVYNTPFIKIHTTLEQNLDEADAEKEENYSEVDPKRIQLAKIFESTLQTHKQSKYYQQVINLLPEQIKGKIRYDYLN